MIIGKILCPSFLGMQKNKTTENQKKMKTNQKTKNSKKRRIRRTKRQI